MVRILRIGFVRHIFGKEKGFFNSIFPYHPPPSPRYKSRRQAASCRVTPSCHVMSMLRGKAKHGVRRDNNRRLEMDENDPKTIKKCWISIRRVVFAKRTIILLD